MKPDCQRWRERSDSYRPGAELIESQRYGVEQLSMSEAKAFVVKHHYSGSFPASRLTVGLFRKHGIFTRAQLCGVAVYSVPMSQSVIPKWMGVPASHGIDLGRFVLLDEVPGNGETWFLARAMKILREEIPTVDAAMACSDPLRRITPSGQVIIPGHVGTIYQALNGRHVGRTGRNTLYVTPENRTISKRALSKLKSGDRGRDYAEQQLLLAGAPRRASHESGAHWIERLRSSGWLSTYRHPGNLVYVWPLGDKRERRLSEKGFREPLPFPKGRTCIEEMTMEERCCVNE